MSSSGAVEFTGFTVYGHRRMILAFETVTLKISSMPLGPGND